MKICVNLCNLRIKIRFLGLCRLTGFANWPAPQSGISGLQQYQIVVPATAMRFNQRLGWRRLPA
jgi:hypothetical protein